MSMSQLPDEIVERILSPLSVPDLYRCILVCKNWHLLICNPHFGALRIQSEKAKPVVGFIFARHIRMRREIRFYPLPYEHCYRTEFYQDYGWSFMDLTGDEKSKVWHTVRRCEMNLGAPGDTLTNWFSSGAHAMDGGLVCEFLKSDRLKVAKVFVYNPIGKTQHVLPFQYLMCRTSNRIQLKMVVDNIAHTYKIYLMNNTDDNGRYVVQPTLRIYDSSTASSGWRSCSRPPSWLITCSVIFDGMLYVMFHGTAPFQLGGFIPPDNWLLRYNPMTDVWEDPNVHYLGLFHSAELVVSDNRLFLVTWMSQWIDVDWWLQITEISFVDRAQPQLKVELRKTNEIGRQLFGEARSSRYSKPPRVNAFGSFRSILLTSRSSGKILIVYDLVKRSFEMLPSNPSESISGEFDPSETWFSTNMNVMNLVLPSDYPCSSETLHNMNRC